MKNTLIATVLVCGLAFSGVALAGCSQDQASSDNSAQEQPQMQTVTVDAAKVTAIDGDKATLTLGTWTGPDMSNTPSGDAGSGEAPSGDNGANSSDGGTPPEMPEGDSNGNSGNNSGDNSGDSQTPPDKPEGDSDSGDGSAPQDGNAPQGGGDMGGEFTEGSETTTIDLSKVEIASNAPGSTEASASDITEGTILQIEKDDSGEITKVTILNAQPADDAADDSSSSNAA